MGYFDAIDTNTGSVEPGKYWNVLLGITWENCRFTGLIRKFYGADAPLR